MIYNITENKFLKAFENLEHGSIQITMPNGKVYSFSGFYDGPNADVTIHDTKAIIDIFLLGDIGFANNYRNGLIDTKDLTSLVKLALLNERALQKCIFGSKLNMILSRFVYLFKQNSIAGSKQNIHSHYDIGNAFYSLWLDETMTYSSAIFLDDAESLKQAQLNKYDRIIDRLSDKEKALEIGCGWGGFAERAITSSGIAVDGITISDEQFKYAKNRIKNLNLVTDSNIIMQDYRKLDGKYANIVSIEMFEAVGEKYWKTYFDKLSALLASKGTAVIQTITIDNKYFENYRKSGDAIRTYIFPGGFLPSTEVFKENASKSGLRVNDEYYFGQHYAKTLKHWLDNFESKLKEVKALGLDEKFIRIWRFYLESCIASFSVGRTNVMQVELQHA
jgi:cyclopropane-fatty-acyl-phospholipid synthase